LCEGAKQGTRDDLCQDTGVLGLNTQGTLEDGSLVSAFWMTRVEDIIPQLLKWDNRAIEIGQNLRLFPVRNLSFPQNSRNLRRWVQPQLEFSCLRRE
jgi:hypothetical protein